MLLLLGINDAESITFKKESKSSSFVKLRLNVAKFIDFSYENENLVVFRFSSESSSAFALTKFSIQPYRYNSRILRPWYQFTAKFTRSKFMYTRINIKSVYPDMPLYR